MPCISETREAIPYHVALVLPGSRRVLGKRLDNQFRFPVIDVPRWRRPAAELQTFMRESWNLSGIILDILPLSETSMFAIAEVFSLQVSGDLVPVDPEEINDPEFGSTHRIRLRELLAGTSSDCPFTQLGWIDDAVGWVERATRRNISSKDEIRQLNAGGFFSLVRFHTVDGWDYWLKATGAPNLHELSITTTLAGLGKEHLPEVVATRLEWNAWLSSGEAEVLDEIPSDPLLLFLLLEDAVASLTELQIKTIGHTSALLGAGAFDRSLKKLQTASDSLFEYLTEAMEQQTSTRVAPLSANRLQELCSMFKRTCDRALDLCLPETIGHGDLNAHNIVRGESQTQFLDWSEAYVGFPLMSIQQLLLLNNLEDSPLKRFINRLLMQRCRDLWSEVCDPVAIEIGFALAPILAIASTLYGRGEWLASSSRDDPQRQAYSRSLARHMDRAVRTPEWLGAICH
jgi:hypothetical protein